jgi:hypothetical protein
VGSLKMEVELCPKLKELLPKVRVLYNSIENEI